jgi:hypothetical protein
MVGFTGCVLGYVEPIATGCHRLLEPDRSQSVQRDVEAETYHVETCDQ